MADKIDFIETGAAAISQSDMESLCRLLPKTRLYNTYASTETGIISTYNYNDGKCMAGCLGKPMKHSEFFITEDGHIACKGDTIMSGYVGDPEKTSTVLRNGIIYTSDMGVIDDEGMLHLKGREDDVINVGGFKVSPVEVEDVALSYYGINDFSPSDIKEFFEKLNIVQKKNQKVFIPSSKKVSGVLDCCLTPPGDHLSFDGSMYHIEKWNSDGYKYELLSARQRGIL